MLRLLACISIILCHIPSNYGRISNTFGVCLFCIISGFMTSKSYKHDTKYLLKKLINLAPLYYVLTILIYIGANVMPQYFNSVVPSISNLLMSLLFIPFPQMGQMGYVYAMHPLGWYMILQMWFYIIYYFIAVIFKDKHDYYFIGISLIVLIFIKITGVNNAIIIQYPQFYFYMVLGVLLNALFKCVNFNPIDKNRYLIQTLLFGLILFFSNKTLYILNVVLVIMMFTISYLFDWHNNKLAKLCSCTYEIYLTHYFIVMAFNRVLPKIVNIDNSNIWIQSVLVLISLLVGYLVSIPNKKIVNKLKRLIITYPDE